MKDHAALKVLKWNVRERDEGDEGGVWWVQRPLGGRREVGV